MLMVGRCARGASPVLRAARLVAFVFLFGACVTCVGAQQNPPQNPVPTPPPHAAAVEAVRDYVIGPQDLLLVSILESPELSREARVGADGSLNLPLLERVTVLGLTLSEAEDLLEKKYREAGILNDPTITITVKDLQSKPVTVSGAVRNPGVFQVNGQSRLLRMISQAGGITDEAGTSVQVIRVGTTSRDDIVSVRMEDVRNAVLEANIPVYGGDIINVQPAGAVYIMGAVNRPGRHLMGSDSGLSVLRAIALAEDLKRTAKPDKAVLIRHDTDGKVQQIPLDIRKILSQKQPDVALLANDVLYVPDSASKRAFTRGLEAALQVATGIAILGAR